MSGGWRPRTKEEKAGGGTRIQRATPGSDRSRRRRVSECSRSKPGTPITITGTNDAPKITSGEQAGSVVEDGVQTASGQVTATDVDDNAVLTYSGSGAGDYGSLSVDEETGAWTYTLANGSTAVQSLHAGEQVTDTFTVTVTDDQGASTTQDVVITITGTSAPRQRVVRLDLQELFRRLHGQRAKQQSVDHGEYRCIHAHT